MALGAIQFTSVTNAGLFTTTVPSGTAYTWGAWCLGGFATGLYSCGIQLASVAATESGFGVFHVNDSGSTGHFEVWDNLGGTQIITTAANGISNTTWYYVSLAVSGTNVVLYWQTYLGTQNSATATGLSVSLAEFDIGVDYGGDPCSIRFAGVKLWNAQLSANDVKLEARQLDPARTTNLFRYWPLSSTSDLTDRVASAVLSTHGTPALTTGIGPPINWDVFAPTPSADQSAPPLSRAGFFFATNFDIVAAASTFIAQASYSDKGQPFSGRVLEAGASTQAAPNPAIYQPLDPWFVPSFPKPGNRGVHEPPTPYTITTASIAQNPSPIYPDRGTAGANRQLDVVTSAWIDPAIFRPNQAAIYPDKGNAKQTQAAAFEPPASQWINPALLQPTPRAHYADRGYAVPLRQVEEPSPQRIDPAGFQPVPESLYPDRGNGQPYADGAYIYVTTFVTVPPAVTPSPIYPDHGASVGYRPADPVANRRIDPAVFQPNAGAIFPDRGSADVVDNGAHVFATTFVIPPPAQIPSPVFSDRGYAVANRPADPPFSQWIDPASFRPIPSALYPVRGYAVPTAEGAFVFVTTYVTPPATPPVPGAVYPDRGTGQSTEMDVFVFTTAYIQTPPAQVPMASYSDHGSSIGNRQPDPTVNRWVNPAIFQPSPAAVYADRGTGYSTAAGTHITTTSYVAPPPGPNPVAIYSDRGYSAPFRPADPTFLLWVSGAGPNPSAVYPDHGYDTRLRPALHLAATTFVLPPPVVNPNAFYSDRGTGKPTAAGVHYVVTSQWLSPAALQPVPSGWYPARGYGIPTAMGAHMFAGFTAPQSAVHTWVILAQTSPVAAILIPSSPVTVVFAGSAPTSPV